jgi:hypothetical protein
MHVAEVHRRLVSELSAADLTMAELFEYPTPRQLAARVGRGAAQVLPRGAGRRHGAPPRAIARRRTVHNRNGGAPHNGSVVSDPAPSGTGVSGDGH